jgi:cytochrome c oxidase subunit 1
MIVVTDNASHEATAARRWLALAIGSLVVAGVLSLMLVVARMPPFDRLVSDPLFFRRCLVVHVDLALVVWFYAFASSLLCAIGPSGTFSITARLAPFVSTAGVALMIASAWSSGAQPVLANYVPMIDDVKFEIGIALFGAGVIAGFLDARLVTRAAPSGAVLPLPAAAEPGLRAAAILILVAALTFASSWLGAPAGLTPDTLVELANWGGGHVLQAAITCVLLSVWIVLATPESGEAPMSRRVSSALFAVLVFPWLLAPLLTMMGIQDIGARQTFTLLMEWGIFPVVLVVLALVVRAIVRSGVRRDPRLFGLAASCGLSLLGFVLGALVHGSNTIVPAHYHASIGAVTAAFMTVAPMLLARLGYPVQRPRLARIMRVQPAVYGVGQMVFATGFALAGAHGMARKVYGPEQAGRGVPETIGLVVMGIGGFVAVAAGIVFLVTVITAWRDGRAAHRTAALSTDPRSGTSQTTKSAHA